MASSKKEQKQKAYLRTTYRKINKMINTLDRSRDNIITRAKAAKSKGDMMIYRQCVNRLKNQAIFRYKAEEMYHNIKTAIDFQDMANVMGAFSKSMQLISGDVTKANKTNNLNKMQKMFDTALDGFGEEMMKLDDFMSDADNTYAESAAQSKLSDKDIETMIAAHDMEAMIDSSGIDERLQKIGENKE